jgi:hypothetical protein
MTARTAWIIMPTHTTRHLRRAIMGAVNQDYAPTRLVVCCDNDQADVRELALACTKEFNAGLVYVERPRMGQSRLAQNRDNGVRAALQLGASGEDQLIFLDGDCPPARGFARWHMKLAAGQRAVLGRRIDLTPAQTEAFDEGALRAGRHPAGLSVGQVAGLYRKHAQWTLHAWLRVFGLTKPHKPKMLGANHSVPVWVFERVNGYDEEYVGYGQEDDDLARRVYAAGVKPSVGTAYTWCYHLWHETRQATGFKTNPGAERFMRGGPVAAVHGLRNPLPQDEPRMYEFDRGAIVRGPDAVRPPSGELKA